METIKGFENVFSNIEHLSENRTLLENDVIKTIYQYFKDMHEIEIQSKDYFHHKNKSLLNQLVNRKKDVHEKYWSNKDIYYQPCSLSTLDRYDWNKVSQIEVLQNYDSENRFATCRMVYDDDIQIFMVKFKESGIFIEHHFSS